MNFIKTVARTVLPRSIRNWIRAPIKSIRLVWDEARYCCGAFQTVEFRPGWKLNCHPMAYRCAYEAQHSDPEQVAEFDSFIAECREGMVLFDIGAHFGLFALAAVHFGGPSALAVAVDPSSSAIRMIRIQSELNKCSDRIKTIEAAVGAKSGHELMVAGGVNSAGYLLPPGPDHSKSELTDTKMVTLDELAREFNCRPTHLKIDVESYEADVLVGGAELLSSVNCPILFLELHNAMVRERGLDPARALELVHNFGYSIYSVSGEALTDDAILGRELIRVVARKRTKN